MSSHYPVLGAVSALLLFVAPSIAGPIGGGGGPGAGPVLINEIRIDQSGSDVDEYFELIGVPGTSLQGLSYVVIGDGEGGSGTIEAVIPLAGTIGASGLFVVAEATFTLGTADRLDNLNFENSDNVTHLLVDGLTLGNGSDLDVDDDCILDVAPWSFVLDQVVLKENDAGECFYGSEIVGPDGTFVPAHVYRCRLTNTWQIGAFGLGDDDTPGLPNPICPLFVFGLPHTPLGVATLQPSPDGGLRVMNIGASGNDGVSADVGVETFRFRQEFGPQQGGRRTTTTSGDGTTLHDIGTNLAQDGQLSILTDATQLNPTSIRIEASLDDGAIRTITLNQVDPSQPLIISNIGSSGKDGIALELNGGGDFNVDSFFDICYGIGYQHNIGGMIVKADFIRVFLEGVPPGPPVSISQINITASGVPSFDLTGAALGPFDLFHSSLGEAHLTTDNAGHLIVSNLGSSGEDGVRSTYPGGGGGGGRMALAFDVVDDDTEGDIIPEIFTRNIGDGGGGGGGAGGTVRVRAPISMSTASVDILPTFFETGDVPTEARLFSNGVQVGSGEVPFGDLAVFTTPTPGTRANGIEYLLGENQLRIRFDNDIQGFGSTGDEVRMNPLATGGVAGPDVIEHEIERIDLGGDGINGIEITGGEGDPPCIGDTDGNGAVDVDDLINVILDWGTDGSGNNGDVNDSGLVDVDDLVGVILAWGPC